MEPKHLSGQITKTAEQPAETIETGTDIEASDGQADDAKPIVHVVEAFAAVAVSSSGNNPHGSGL